ncbi:hypothetical protein D3C76_1563240 [compost metagenome]
MPLVGNRPKGAQKIHHHKVIQEHAVADVPEDFVNPVKFELRQQVHGRNAQRNASGHLGVERPALDPPRHDRHKNQCCRHGGAGSNR